MSENKRGDKGPRPEPTPNTGQAGPALRCTSKCRTRAGAPAEPAKRVNCFMTFPNRHKHEGPKNAMNARDSTKNNKRRVDV